MKTKLSRIDRATRDQKILELSKSGVKQAELARKFSVSPQRIGQIVTNYKKPYKSLKKKALSIVDQVSTKTKTKNNLIEGIVNSNMGDDLKLELLKKLY